MSAPAPHDAELVAWVTGEDSPNRTASRFAVHATDLGIPWDDGRGGVLVAFGDTYGAGWGGNGAGPPHADWRCNVLGRSSATDLSDGMALDDFVEDAPGHAAQILERDPLPGREETVIPTAGIALGGRNYLHYMSVQRWGLPGRWRTNYAGIAYSDDGGRSWVKDRVARWPNRWRGRHPFQLAAFAHDGEHLHVLGTPNGRFGAAHLARVRPDPGGDADPVLDPGAYEYYDGARWQRDRRAAVPVVPGPVAELSVEYSARLGRWLMLHLDEHRAAIVLRTATSLTGPWTGPDVVVSGRDHPALYGSYLHPWTVDGPEVYFTMSRWGPYNVALMRFHP